MITLRSVNPRGWDATGRLKPLWHQLEGPSKREQLAELADVRPTELSSHNNGKPIGMDVALRIIDGLRRAGVEASLDDLGWPGPDQAASPSADALLAEVSRVREELAQSERWRARMESELAEIRRLLEAQTRVASAES